MSWILPPLTRYAALRTEQFIRKTHDPIAVQEKFLRTFLQHYRHTTRGQEYRIEDLKSVDQFRDRLPVTQYTDYVSEIERMAAGDRNLLAPDPVRFMTLTSGTTGPRKWIPVTQRLKNALQRASMVSFGFLLRELRAQNRQLGKALVTNSVQPTGKTSAGIEYGLASTGSLRMSQLLAAPLFAHPFASLQIADSRTRHYLCLLFSLRCRELQSIAANFPMLLLRTGRYLEAEAELLIRDLRTGTLSDNLQLTAAERKDFQKLWTADPQRADELAQILQHNGRLTPQAAWPHLTLLSTARGGTSDFYFQRFPDYFGTAPIWGGVYGCSEATFGIAHALNEDGCILALDSGFYEFVPESEWDADHPQTLLAPDVKIGDRYRILVTNDTGFYRYDIRDVVEVVGFYAKTPLIVFRYRLGGQLNSTSEKTTEFHVVQVMNRLQQEFNVELEDFCITLSDADIPAHYWVNLELCPGFELADPVVFLQRFDTLLQAENGHYQIMRQDQVPSPGLRILAPGSFARLCKGLQQRGIPENQLKIPHISENRSLLSELNIVQEFTWPQG